MSIVSICTQSALRSPYSAPIHPYPNQHSIEFSIYFPKKKTEEQTVWNESNEKFHQNLLTYMKIRLQSPANVETTANSTE